ncbi:hypothetical protein ACHAQH_000179 [Verticillium albo-atrum]
MAVETAFMASTTRSSRRVPVGTATAAVAPDAHANAPFHAARNSTQNILPHTTNGRTKRHLSISDRDRDLDPTSPAKRPRTEFEILLKSSRSTTIPKHPAAKPAPPDAVSLTPKPKHPRPQQQHQQQQPQHNKQQKLPFLPVRRETAAVNPPPADAQPSATEDAAQLTKHRAKVINGIRHELDRLQPDIKNNADADPKEQQRGGRKLRSQEATRFKSDLSAYFPDYDEVIGNDPKEEHLLNVETPIIIVDTFPRYFRGKVVAPLFTPTQSEPAPANYDHGDYPVRGYGDALFDDPFDSQRINFDFLGKSYKGKTLDSALPDALYVPIHKRAERLERSIRNTEKGRAQHEKDQIVRLLEGLQGHDWLRIMGVSGVTESKKKSFEPARRHFIKGCQAIIDKFRQWAQEEKRRKAEKDRALAEEADEEDADEEEEAEEDEGAEEDDDDDEEKLEIADSDDDEDNVSDGDPPDEHDFDASIAKQLREEAAARSNMAKTSRKRPRAVSAQPEKPLPPPREFKSFFKKKHERDAALNKHRRAGRRVLAWGEPVPETEEREFELPEEYLDPETMKAHARKRRRQRRGSRH